MRTHPKHLILFFEFMFIGVQLLYNAVLVSGVRPSESVAYIHFLWFCLHIGHYRVLSRVPWARQEVLQFSSVQFSHSVMSDSLRPHELQHVSPPCPSPTPGIHPNSCPSSQWCHPAISSAIFPSPPAPRPSQLQSRFQWVNSLHEVAKVLEFQL